MDYLGRALQKKVRLSNEYKLFFVLPYDVWINVYDYSRCSSLLSHGQWEELQMARNVGPPFIVLCTSFFHWLEESSLKQGDRIDHAIIFKKFQNALEMFNAREKAGDHLVWQYFGIFVNYVNIVLTGFGSVEVIKKVREMISFFLLDPSTMYIVDYVVANWALRIKKAGPDVPNYMTYKGNNIIHVFEGANPDIFEFNFQHNIDTKKEKEKDKKNEQDEEKNNYKYIDVDGKLSNIVSLADMTWPIGGNTLKIKMWVALYWGHIKAKADYIFGLPAADYDIEHVNDKNKEDFKSNLKDYIGGALCDIFVRTYIDQGIVDSISKRFYNGEYFNNDSGATCLFYHLIRDRLGRNLYHLPKHKRICHLLKSHYFNSLFKDVLVSPHRDWAINIHNRLRERNNRYYYLQYVTLPRLRTSILINYYLEYYYAGLEGKEPPERPTYEEIVNSDEDGFILYFTRI